MTGILLLAASLVAGCTSDDYQGMPCGDPHGIYLEVIEPEPIRGVHDLFEGEDYEPTDLNDMCWICPE